MARDSGKFLTTAITRRDITPVATLGGLLVFFTLLNPVFAEPLAGWALPGGALGGGHFSPARQITRDNVTELEIAWTHRSGDFREGENFL